MSAVQRTWNAAHVLFFALFIGIILGYGHGFKAESKHAKELRIAAAKAERKREEALRFNARITRFAEKACKHDQWYAREKIAALQDVKWQESDYLRIELIGKWQNIVDDNCRKINEDLQKKLRKI